MLSRHVYASLHRTNDPNGTLHDRRREENPPPFAPGLTRQLGAHAPIVRAGTL